MTVNKLSPIPLYFQIKEIILDRIHQGIYTPGSLVPSERELCEEFQCSRMTVRHALSQLVVESVLQREKGRGTFVTYPRIEQRNIMSFSEMIESRGLIPSADILDFSRTQINGGIHVILRINETDKVYKVKRLRKASGKPIGIEDVYLPEKTFPECLCHDFKGSLYRMLENKYGFNIYFIDSKISASLANKDERKHLQIPETLPVLRFRNIYHNDKGNMCFYEETVYRADEFQYDVRAYNKDF